jgi:hypothetical protein
MAEVRKAIFIAVLENAEIFEHEQWEMEKDMRDLPWVWVHEPSILYNFEQWWEKQLHDRNVKKVLPYC